MVLAYYVKWKQPSQGLSTWVTMSISIDDNHNTALIL